MPRLTLDEIPGLAGYLWVDDTLSPSPVDPRSSDEVASMFLTVPIISGRDLNDLVVEVRGDEEWMRFGSSLFRPRSSLPNLTDGPNEVGFGVDGFAEWRAVPADTTLRVADAGGWRLYDADGTPLAGGSGDGDEAAAPAGSLLVVFGDPGSVAEVRATG
jgi:hypothetical protein